MKKTLLLLSLAGCFALPAITRADLPTTPTKTTRISPAPAHPSSNKVIYYITQQPRTGSNIPTVYRRYNGWIDSAASPAVYGQTSIAQSGAFDLQSALFMIDPSITSRSRH